MGAPERAPEPDPVDLLALTLSQPGPVVCPTLTPPPAACAPRRSATLVIDDDMLPGRRYLQQLLHVAAGEQLESEDEVARALVERQVAHDILVLAARQGRARIG